jgi:hypothetical protein
MTKEKVPVISNDSSSLSFDFLNDEDDSFANDDDDDDGKKLGLQPDDDISLSEHDVERRFVTCTRLLLLFVMLGAGGVAGLITYRYVGYDQEEEMNQSVSTSVSMSWV